MQSHIRSELRKRVCICFTVLIIIRDIDVVLRDARLYDTTAPIHYDVFDRINRLFTACSRGFSGDESPADVLSEPQGSVLYATRRRLYVPESLILFRTKSRLAVLKMFSSTKLNVDLERMVSMHKKTVRTAIKNGVLYVYTFTDECI